jgi:hypothetical protein
VTSVVPVSGKLLPNQLHANTYSTSIGGYFFVQPSVCVKLGKKGCKVVGAPRREVRRGGLPMAGNAHARQLSANLTSSSSPPLNASSAKSITAMKPDPRL